MTEADIAYARKHLDDDLMEKLNYKHPEKTTSWEMAKHFCWFATDELQ